MKSFVSLAMLLDLSVLYEVHLKSIRYGDQMNWKSSSKFLETIVVVELLSSYNMQLQNFLLS